MESWYLYSLAALLLLGCQRFLYKVAAERGASSSLTTAIFMASVAVLSGVTFLATGTAVGDFKALALFSLINSSSFAGATIAHIEALKRLPAGVTFPLTRLSLVLVILFSLVYFDESLHPLQWAGVLLGMAVVVLLRREAGKGGSDSRQTRSGLLLVLAGVLCGAISAISCKFAVLHTDKAAFMALSYIMATVFSLAINRRWRPARTQSGNADAIKIGLGMGLLNFFGFYALLTAMAAGPLSSIILITGMHFVIAIALSVLLYKEKMTWRRAVGIALTLVAVALMKQP